MFNSQNWIDASKTVALGTLCGLTIDGCIWLCLTFHVVGYCFLILCGLFILFLTIKGCYHFIKERKK